MSTRMRHRDTRKKRTALIADTFCRFAWNMLHSVSNAQSMASNTRSGRRTKLPSVVFKTAKCQSESFKKTSLKIAMLMNSVSAATTKQNRTIQRMISHGLEQWNIVYRAGHCSRCFHRGHRYSPCPFRWRLRSRRDKARTPGVDLQVCIENRYVGSTVICSDRDISVLFSVELIVPIWDFIYRSFSRPKALLTECLTAQR